MGVMIRRTVSSLAWLSNKKNHRFGGDAQHPQQNTQTVSITLTTTTAATTTTETERETMVKVLVAFYSTYGHNFAMAQAVADGAKQVGEDIHVDLKRIPETLPEEVLVKMGALEAQKAFSHLPIVSTQDVEQYDAIIIGGPTRFGTPCSQVLSFLGTLGGVWAGNKLVGKIGSAWTSSATQHGGNEATIRHMHTPMLHLGMIVVGLPYSCTDQFGVEEVKGGSPYGVTTIAGGDGSRLPSEPELNMARFQGKHVASITRKLFGVAKPLVEETVTVISTTEATDIEKTTTKAPVTETPATNEIENIEPAEQEKQSLQPQSLASTKQEEALPQKPSPEVSTQKKSSCCIIS